MEFQSKKSIFSENADFIFLNITNEFYYSAVLFTLKTQINIIRTSSTIN